MAETDDPAEKSPVKVEPVVLTPAEIPGQALLLLSRQLQLVAAAQSEIARGLQPVRNRDGKIVSTELGADGAIKAMSALVAGARFLTEVHELFAPRANAEQPDDRITNELVASAAAEKLLAAVKRDEVRQQAETIRPARVSRSTSAAVR